MSKYFILISTIFLLHFISLINARRFKSDADSSGGGHRDYEIDIAAMSALRQFNSDCIDKKIPAEERFQLLAQEWPKLILSMRMSSQVLNGPLHEGFAIARLFRQMWAVYGFAVAPSYDIKIALGSIVNFRNDYRWVEPYAGTGYFAMQVQNLFNVSVDAWDLKSYDQKWLKILTTDSTKQDISPYDVLLLSYPCTQEKGCWAALERFTESIQSKIVVYFGEPRGHCCGDKDMWDHLCLNWDLKISRKIEKGFPGSYNYLMVFTKKIGNKKIKTLPVCNNNNNDNNNNDNDVQNKNDKNCIPQLNCEGDLCPQTQFGPLLQFYETCEMSRKSFIV